MLCYLRQLYCTIVDNYLIFFAQHLVLNNQRELSIISIAILATIKSTWRRFFLIILDIYLEQYWANINYIYDTATTTANKSSGFDSNLKEHFALKHNLTLELFVIKEGENGWSRIG